MNHDTVAGGTPVPVLDVGAARDGSPTQRAALAELVGDACARVGFFVVEGHGVAPGVISDIYSTTAAFFDRPLAEKLRCASPDGHHYEGFAPMDLEVPGTHLAGRPNLLEMYRMALHDDAAAATAAGFRADVSETMVPNHWPDRPAGFQVAWRRYFDELRTLADALLEVCAIALDVDRQSFRPSFDQPLSTIVANHYPPQPVAPAPGQFRLAEHVDFSAVTLLFQDGAPGGLEVHHAGGWWPVPARPDSFVVNIGDLLARWTNERWRATRHRVANPAPAEASTRRISIPFFHMPNHDAVIEPIAACVDERGPRFAPVTGGEWVLLRRAGVSADHGRLRPAETG